MRIEPHKLRQQRQREWKTVRLNVERLESRRLLAGLNVWVTVDDGVAGDPIAELNAQPAADRIVYVDLNQNGLLEADEPVAITGIDGRAFFAGLAAGDYSVRLLTDNIRQRQTSPATIEQTQTLSVPVESRWLIGDARTSMWGLSDDGILTLIQSASNSPASQAMSILELGGQPVSVVNQTATETWISYRTDSQSRLAVFNSQTRELRTFHVSSSANLVDLATDGQTIYGVLNSLNRSSIVKLSPNSFGNTGKSEIAAQTGAGNLFTQLEMVGDRLVALQEAGSDVTVELFDTAGSRLASLPTTASTSLTADAATGSVVLSTNAGLAIFETSGDRLALVATIAEASAPVAFDGPRLIATDRGASNRLTVWNSENWLPVDRLQLDGSEVRQIVADAERHIQVLDGWTVHNISLAAARAQHVVLSADEIADVDFRVENLVAPEAPAVPETATQVSAENQSTLADLSQIIQDRQGNMLWYSVLTGPLHGEVALTPSGKLVFTPQADFFGSDSITIRVHDGQSSADVALNWQVTEANDPPSDMIVTLDSVSEAAVAGTAIGTVRVVDQNALDSYRITVSDPRFRVEDGRILLNESLDFEAGASIELDLTAIDAVGEFSISSHATVKVTNVAEAPEGVTISSLSIDENLAPTMVGRIFVVAPDADGAYEITVDDSRFEVRGDELWLNEPLNYEAAKQVQLQLTATDKNHPAFVVRTQTSLQVNNQDDPAEAISVNNLNVPEQTAGAQVGTIAVVDEDGDQYQFFVSDSRFEVVGGILKLSDNASLDRQAELTIPLTVTAINTHGGSIVVKIPLAVIPPPSPWQNPTNPVDVNNDGRVSPVDALVVIKYLNDVGPGQTPGSSEGGSGEMPTFPDVNGDGRITPIDALLIINELNDRSRSEGEGEFSLASAPPVIQIQPWNDDADQRRRENSKIDAELEMLLDQLANPNSQHL